MKHLTLAIFIMILAFKPLFSQTITGFDDITDIEGNTHSLSTYLDDNKYVLLNFYLETCGNCMATAPLIESIYQNYGQNECNIVVLSFIIDNQAPFPTNNDCENWAINNGITGPPNFNYTEADWYQFYSNHGGGFAQTYLVSPYGDSVIYAHAGGVLNYNNLEPLLNDISLEISASIIQEENSLNAIVENDNLNYVFEWSTGENSQQINPSSDGDYWVIISDQNNCISDTSFIYFQSVNSEETWSCVEGVCGIIDDGTGEFSSLAECEANCNATSIIENNLEVNIYPNPSSNIFNLEFDLDSEAEMSVTNILGEQVYFESTKSIGEFNTQIDLSNYSKGIYNLTIKTSDGISNHKLILQ